MSTTIDRAAKVDRPGIIVTHTPNMFGRGTRVELLTRGGRLIDLSDYVTHVTTETGIDGIVEYRVSFLSGVIGIDPVEIEGGAA